MKQNIFLVLILFGWKLLMLCWFFNQFIGIIDLKLLFFLTISSTPIFIFISELYCYFLDPQHLFYFKVLLYMCYNNFLHLIDNPSYFLISLSSILVFRLSYFSLHHHIEKIYSFFYLFTTWNLILRMIFSLNIVWKLKMDIWF